MTVTVDPRMTVTVPGFWDPAVVSSMQRPFGYGSGSGLVKVHDGACNMVVNGSI